MPPPCSNGEKRTKNMPGRIQTTLPRVETEKWIPRSVEKKPQKKRPEQRRLPGKRKDASGHTRSSDYKKKKSGVGVGVFGTLKTSESNQICLPKRSAQSSSNAFKGGGELLLRRAHEVQQGSLCKGKNKKTGGHAVIPSTSAKGSVQLNKKTIRTRTPRPLVRKRGLRKHKKMAVSPNKKRHLKQ